MAFRKRNDAVGRGTSAVPVQNTAKSYTALGVRPSPLSSHPVTSTGTSSLDELFGGHTGLALDSSLLVEESGTTDFAGALLRFYAAEGVCQGHVVHVVGVGDAWVRDLPGTADEKGSRKKAVAAEAGDKMKIAWRYERLGPTGERERHAVKAVQFSLLSTNASLGHSTSEQDPGPTQTPFSHSLDLSKRLNIPPDAKINTIPIRPEPRPFDIVVRSLTHSLKSSPTNSIHRLVIPSILSPAIWPPDASRPEHFLRFLHSLRALLAQYPGQLTAMITMPLELFPRSSGLVRWAELLCDGVLELTPFPHLMNATDGPSGNGGARGTEDQPQGMLKVHKLPIDTERGEGGAGAGNTMGADLAFTVSRRNFIIKPFSLPPMEGDQDAQQEAGKLTGKDVEF